MTDQCAPGDHAPEFIKDWFGDPTLPNGTVDCSFYRCAICGEELGNEELDNERKKIRLF